MSDTREAAYFEELSRARSQSPRSLEDARKSTNGRSVATEEVKNHIAEAVLKEGTRLQQEFQEASSEIREHVIRQEALLRDHQDGLDNLQSRVDRLRPDFSIMPGRVAQLENVVDMLSARLDLIEASAASRVQSATIHNQNVELSTAIPAVDRETSAVGSEALPAECFLDVLPGSSSPKPELVGKDEMKHNIGSEQLLKYIDGKIAMVTAQLMQQFKAETLDEIGTRLHSSAPKEEEPGKSPSFQALDTLEPVPRPPANYRFTNSIWDLAWFIGQEELGQGGTMMVSLLYALNLVMQASFCVICHRNFTESAFSKDALDGLHDFRVASAHDYRFFDQVFGKSLIEQICLEDAVYAQNSMVYGAYQLDVRNTVQEYLDDETDGFLSLFAGPYMCLLALACWALCAIRQLLSIGLCLGALVRIPRGPHTVITTGEIKCIGRGRFRFILAIESQEIAICILLLIYGCIWLSQTSNIQELLLNAAALEFVLSIDEMIFDALAPLHSQSFIESMAPLPVGTWTECRGVDPFALARIFSLLGVVMIFYISLVSPLVTNMRAAKSALCGEKIGFLYGIDQFGLVWIENTHKVLDAVETLMRPEARKSLRDVILKRTNPNTAGELPYAVDVRLQKVSTIVNTDASAYTDRLNPFCEDLLGTFPVHSREAQQAQTFLHYVRVFTQNSSISNCKDLRAMGVCSTVGHPAIMFCSSTCTCWSPVSHVFSHLPVFGCPSSCLENRYQDRLLYYRTNCTDLLLHDLQVLGTWKSWTDQLVKASNSSFTRTLAFNMSKFGCGFITFQQNWWEYCDGLNNQSLRPLGPICPKTCKCDWVSSHFCPVTCHVTV